MRGLEAQNCQNMRRKREILQNFAKTGGLAPSPPAPRSLSLVDIKITNVYFSSDMGKSLTGVSVFSYLSQNINYKNKLRNITSSCRLSSVIFQKPKALIRRPKGGLLILSPSRTSSWSGVLCVAGKNVNFYVKRSRVDK